MSTLALDTPITVSPFNKIWIESINVHGNPDGAVSANIALKPFNGTKTLDDRKVFVINDVFALAAADPQFANIIYQLMEEVGRQARLKGVI